MKVKNRSHFFLALESLLMFMLFSKTWVRSAPYKSLELKWISSRSKLQLYSRKQDCEGVEKAMAPTPILLPGKSHGRRSPVGCSPWGRWELDMTQWLHFHFSFSCTGEGNGNPFQCSCLENPRDGGAWWAAVYGVTLSRTQLKWLSSSRRTKKQTLMNNIITEMKNIFEGTIE